jgi:SAM-dependent methyltransferase
MNDKAAYFKDESRRMDERMVADCWDANAPAWTELARQGFDIYRDEVNLPAFLAMLPEVSGRRILDIGCGEGHHARLLAQKGAKLVELDRAWSFIKAADQEAKRKGLSVASVQGTGTQLPFADSCFDLIIATMSLMDMPTPEKAIHEAARVLKSGGVFQFSILHPCFATPKWEWVADQDGRRFGLICGQYFEQLEGETDEWIFHRTPEAKRKQHRPFRVPRFTRTLSQWMNTLIQAGLVVEAMDEPQADSKTLERYPELYDTNIIAYFLIVRCRKP